MLYRVVTYGCYIIAYVNMYRAWQESLSNVLNTTLAPIVFEERQFT